MRVLVVSPGGMGCSGVLRTIANAGIETNCVQDSDGLKHHSGPLDPRYHRFGMDSVVYVWNDPLLAITSLWRRGWLGAQREKLTGTAADTNNSLADLWVETLTNGRDVFGIEQHCELWLAQMSWPMFVMDLRESDNRRPALARFLGTQEESLFSLRLKDRASSKLIDAPNEIHRIYERLDLAVQAKLKSDVRSMLPRDKG